MLEKIFNLIKKIKRVFFPFYKDKELKFVFQKFQEGHPSDKIVARFVGGCVRKYLSNDDIDDIDIATTLSSEEIKERYQVDEVTFLSINFLSIYLTIYLFVYQYI